MGIYKSLNCGLEVKIKKQMFEKNLEIVAKNLKVEKNELLNQKKHHSNKVEFIEG